jgi:hypothetical protein
MKNIDSISKEEVKCICTKHDPYCCQIHGSCPICVEPETLEDVVLGYKTSLVAQMLDSNNKQETLEEAAAKHFNNEIFVEGVTIQYALQEAFTIGAEWQAKRMYSEEDMKQFAFECVAVFLSNSDNKIKIKLVNGIVNEVNNKFEQFKK